MAVRRLRQLQQVLCLQRSFASTCNSQNVLQVSPEISRFDEKVHIQLQGLPSHGKVTLHALVEGVWQQDDIQFASCGHYTASQTGEVDLEKDSSTGGTYTGVEPMGLFWSMAANPFGPKNVRLVARDVEKPVSYKLSVYQDHLSFDDLFKDRSQHQPLATRTLDRAILGPGVRRIPVTEGKLRGVLFLPPGEGPFPGVVDMFGIAGGLMEIRAALLASYGFAAYALPFFRYKDLPKFTKDQTFDYFEEAARWLASHPSVTPGGIGVIGVSGGAAYGSMMGYMCPEVKAVVRINGQTLHSLMEVKENKPGGRHFKPGIKIDFNKCITTEEGVVMKDGWVLDDDQILPLWEKDVHVLALVCDDDGQMHPWVSDQHRQLYPEHRRHLMEVVHYPKAGHLLEPPFTPLCRVCYNPYFNVNLVWGGYVREHAAAQEDAWPRVHQFLRKHLPSTR